MRTFKKTIVSKIKNIDSNDVRSTENAQELSDHLRTQFRINFGISEKELVLKNVIFGRTAQVFHFIQSSKSHQSTRSEIPLGVVEHIVSVACKTNNKTNSRNRCFGRQVTDLRPALNCQPIGSS